MVLRRAAKKNSWILLLSLAAVSLLSASSPALTLDEALEMAKSTLPCLPGAGDTRTVLGGPLQGHPRGLRSQCRCLRDRVPAQHRGLRLLDQQLRRDRLAQALRLQAGLYTGYRPLRFQLRTGRSPQEPPGPRVQRQVLFLHDPGNPGHPRAEKNSARECPEKLRGGRRAEKVRRGKALRRSSGLREIGAGPLQPGSVGRQPPEEPLGAEFSHRHTHYRRRRAPGGPDL